jgi:hypothetical protein
MSNRKRDAFVSKGIRIETNLDFDGRWFVCWKPDVSIYCRTRKEVLKFTAWPIKTPTGDSLRGWLDGLEQMDQERVSRKDGLSQELLDTGFGPECHDVDNDNTRMIT